MIICLLNELWFDAQLGCVLMLQKNKVCGHVKVMHVV
jgi:hypothetical protein